MSNSGCVFCFLCVLPQRQAIFVKMPLPPRMHLWDPMCLFPQRRAFFTRWLVLPTTWPLECHTVETSCHVQHVWISIANCGYAKVWKCKRTYYVVAVAMHVNIPPHPTPPHTTPKWRSCSVAWSASEDHLASHEVQVKIMWRSMKCKWRSCSVAWSASEDHLA